MAAIGTPARRRRPWATALIVVALAVGLAACAPGSMKPGQPMGDDHMYGMMGGSTATTAEPSQPLDDAREIRVDAGAMWFEPDVIEVAAGEPVNLTVTNRGQVFHDLAIDELGLRIDLDPEVTATGGLQVDQPGTYCFVCSVPGHAAAGMEGVSSCGDPPQSVPTPVVTT